MKIEILKKEKNKKSKNIDVHLKISGKKTIMPLPPKIAKDNKLIIQQVNRIYGGEWQAEEKKKHEELVKRALEKGKGAPVLVQKEKGK